MLPLLLARGKVDVALGGLADIVVKAEDTCANPRQGKVQKLTNKEKPARNEKEGWLRSCDVSQ